MSEEQLYAEGPSSFPVSSVVVMHCQSNDYYVGDNSALYINGTLVWTGYHNDELENIVSGIFGDGVVVCTTDREYSLELKRMDFPDKIRFTL